MSVNGKPFSRFSSPLVENNHSINLPLMLILRSCSFFPFVGAYVETVLSRVCKT